MSKSSVVLRVRFHVIGEFWYVTFSRGGLPIFRCTSPFKKGAKHDDCLSFFGHSFIGSL